MEPIYYWNRHTAARETEQVYGEGFLRWAYGNPLGKIALQAFVKRPFFSRWYGRRMDREKSAAMIAPFLQRYPLDVSEFADEISSFRTFNEFFYRKLKASARPIVAGAGDVAFPADGRHLGFEHAEQVEGVFVKGQRWNLAELLGSEELAARYRQGVLILSRLCPVDYHRFHFPVCGLPGKTKLIEGPLFSVSPHALRQNLGYMWENKRTITELESEEFGCVLLLEIGATCVGTIGQTYQPGKWVKRGDEKGFFAFGGSSVITIFEPNRVKLADDLRENSLQGIELYAKMGTLMARKSTETNTI